MITPFIATLGGAAFLFAALYIIQDRRKADVTVQCKLTISILKRFSKERERKQTKNVLFFRSNESIE